MKKLPPLLSALVSLALGSFPALHAAAPPTLDAVAAETLHPYAGPSSPGVDCSTLDGKIMCGYQGWFAAEGDGCGRGWYHWTGHDGFKPGSCKIDFWPDVSELDPDERYATPFRLADGSAAEVYSAFNAKTVIRHFQWMRDYGIDGVFVQRFVGEVIHPAGLRQFNTVLDHCREGANRFGRAYAVMYDLSGLRAGQMDEVETDWRNLVDKMHVTDDPAYLHHHGKPVVAVWGVGFSDHRAYTLDECSALVAFLKQTPAPGGCTIMLGAPTYWRTLQRDATSDPKLLDLIAQADIVSPWTVGRYANVGGAAAYAAKTLTPDLAWCNAHGKDYLPVVYPGTSWHNMYPNSPMDNVPRAGGEFLWTQFAEAKKAGVKMIYQAMFDEVDEGTAIYKCTNQPPVGASTFLTYDGQPSDFYLKLVGEAGQLLRGEIPWRAQYRPGAGAPRP